MTTQDLTQLPAPTVVEALDFETILASHRADLIARYPAAAEVIGLESEPLAKLLEAHALRELIYRQRVNDAARAYLLAYATGSDLDHKGAFYGVPRLPGETDERYRVRIQLRIRALAGNGTREHYELVAMTADQNVYDATAVQPSPAACRCCCGCTIWPRPKPPRPRYWPRSMLRMRAPWACPYPWPWPGPAPSTSPPPSPARRARRSTCWRRS